MYDAERVEIGDLSPLITLAALGRRAGMRMGRSAHHRQGNAHRGLPPMGENLAPRARQERSDSGGQKEAAEWGKPCEAASMGKRTERADGQCRAPAEKKGERSDNLCAERSESRLSGVPNAPRSVARGARGGKAGGPHAHRTRPRP